MTHHDTDHLPDWIAQYPRIDTFEEVQEVMRSPSFVQGGSPVRQLFLRDTLMMLDGERHRERKKVVNSLFTSEAMVGYESRLLDPTIAEVMGELRAARGADGLVRTDLVPLVRTLLYRISARITGVDGVDTPERTERFRQLLARVGETVQGQFLLKSPEDVLREGMSTLRELVDEFLQASLERRQDLVRQHRAGALPREQLPMDVLTLICLHGDDARAAPDDTPYFSYIWRECALFLTASAQTTTHALPHVVVHIHDWIGQHPEDAGKLGDSDFLRRAMAESLRLHHGAPAKFRIASEDVTLATTGRKVAKGEMVALITPPANLDNEVFGADAAVFNPNRERNAKAQPWGLTFGAGPHMCVGRALVTGTYKRPDDDTGTEGTMVKILKVLYAQGAQLDPQDPPRLTTRSYVDAYESVPLILRAL